MNNLKFIHSENLSELGKMSQKGVILKKGKEAIFYQRHHWIFSGAIESYPQQYEDGEIVPVYSFMQTILGFAYFNRKSGLAGRIISFGPNDPYEEMQHSLEEAVALRKSFFDASMTNAFRLVNGEGDCLPGLVVDCYGPYLVLQCGTLGADRLKRWVVSKLRELIPFEGVYEKSTAPSRREEGLIPLEDTLWGAVSDEVIIQENGHFFQIEIKKGQKTGFFLDQREMRNWISSIAHGKNLLNLFSYSGGFTIYALKGGAKRVDSVDISKDAMDLCRKNVIHNGFDPQKLGFYSEDAFAFLRTRPLEYDIVILDPPAFAKKKADIPNACKGYKEINKQALQKMPSKSILLTCSCSYHIDHELFNRIILQAAKDVKRKVKLIGKHRMAVDHPVNLYHQESDYLKTVTLFLD